MKIDPLICPQAERRRETMIWCRKAGDWCGHQRFKSCKGWFVMVPTAEKCPLRKEQDDGKQTK